MNERIPRLPDGTVGRAAEWERLTEFAAGDVEHPTLGIVWGRRRIGKSYLLSQLCQPDGLYYEAVRGSASEALRELGAAIAAVAGAPAPLDLPDWDTAISALMGLGVDRQLVVVLDEYPYLREQSPELDSIVQRAFGVRRPPRSQCRLILCGSAISVMSDLLAGTAPLRGRASLDLRISPFDYRDAVELYGTTDLQLSVRLYSIIGGVAAYARDMVDDEMPARLDGLGRWAARRVLAPSAPLSREVELLLSEDPTTSQARKLNLYHATLAAIANGRRTPGRIADYVRISGPRLDPILRGLVAAQFADRVVDPVRDNRPTYHPADPIIRFHYAILRPNHTMLGRHGADLVSAWSALQDTFLSNVVGPTFESIARHWMTHYADLSAVADGPVHIGPSTVAVDDGEREVDIVVARDDSDQPGRRTVAALGEAKSGQELTPTHLARLEAVRRSFGERADGASLYLVGSRFSRSLETLARGRSDVELVDLDRLYSGS